MKKNQDHFVMIYWFIVGLCIFGAAFTVFCIYYLPKEQSGRMADTSMIFWLSTAVSGGIGYLIGSSAKPTPPSEPTDNPNIISATETKTLIQQPPASNS